MAHEQQRFLVSGADTLDTVPGQLLLEVEPVYPVANSSGLRFPPIFQASMADYFSHCVARNPKDLRSHVRRIFLAREQGHGADLFAALVDLFIALGQKGLGLRQRMLELSRELLPEGEYELLRASLVRGMETRMVVAVPGSMLNSGVAGTLKLVRSAVEASAVARDPLVEAREYLEYSQLDEAREVLERAILEAPSRPELHQELLEIYRSTRDHTNFAKMFKKLDGMTNPLAEAWRALADLFGSRDV